MNKKYWQFTLLGILISLHVFSQKNIVADRIIGVVGNSIILQSDFEQQMLQYKAQRMRVEPCFVFENFLIQKLMVNQAKVDSIEVSDATVEMQLNNRIEMYIQQAGSREKLEEYFNRSLPQIKEDMRLPMREQLIMQKMQGEITKNLKITPSEVEDFYRSFPADSIPLVNTQYEYKQIVIHPPYTDQTIFEIKNQLLNLRKAILEGRSFASLAVIYSEDQASAVNGGEIGFMSRGELDPEYAKVAFSLKEGAVSGIVETQFGYHIIQVIKRDGDRVNTRHILMRPRPTEKEIKFAFNKLDSILSLIKKDSITFEKAAFLFSTDNETRMSYGQVVNPYNSSTRFEIDQLPQEDFVMLKKLNIGEISTPFQATDAAKRPVFKIVKLVNRIEPHKANLKDDYQLIQEMALENKKKKIIKEWIDKKIQSTYIRIDPSFANCKFEHSGWKK
ncbi:MAG: peptidylprolyl isomerase [Bacteroidales bacterium]|nr:peptidylprolyl isomerase [Bacteroidales bacterium]